MTTVAIDLDPRIRARSEFHDMLLDLDERVEAIELSWVCASNLGRDEWLALRDVAGRNVVPLRIH